MKFQWGIFLLEDKSCLGRLTEVDDEIIQTLIDCHITEREIGEKLNIPKSAVHNS